MKRLLLLSVVLGTFYFATANTLPTVNKRVEGIYKQQLALQTIIKDFMMMGANVNVKDARNDLDEKVAFLEESYLEYMDYAGMNEEVMKIFEKGSEDWMQLRMLVVDEVTPANASKLIKTNTQLHFLLSSLLQQEKKNDNFELSKDVEKAYEMQIYIDRIAAYYYANMWGIDKEVAVRSIAGAKMYFENIKNQLKNSEVNSIQINGKFTNIENQWNRFKKITSQPTTRKSVVEEFSYVYQEIVSDLHSITTMYENIEETSRTANTLKKKSNQNS